MIDFRAYEPISFSIVPFAFHMFRYIGLSQDNNKNINYVIERMVETVDK